MKNIFLTVCMSLSLALPSFAQAQAQDELPKVKGLVRLVDVANAKIKIKHEVIPNLNMPPMTMTFWVAEPLMIEGISVNDKILFSAEQIDGQYVVVWLEKQN